MSAIAPDPADLIPQLPANAFYHLVRTLRLTLPPTDRPEDLSVRDQSAIARIAALAPASAAEADLAALFVAASEQWKDCLRLAEDPSRLPEIARKCRAQAASMMRQSLAALRLLQRAQAIRQKTEANDIARDRAAWTEHCAAGLMLEGLYPLAGGALPPPVAPAAP
jgi:hypothetical protein